MSLKNKILLALFTGFVAIQFIQPAHNKSGQVLPTDVANFYAVPANIKNILKNACYDCHSNNTIYPWYANIQPMAWMLERHIKQGKEKLNFNDFGSYTNRRQISKLKEILNQIKDDEMPITSYKLMHKNAKLSQDEKNLLINWLQSTVDSLSAIN
jgi:hypothetical protein